MWKRYLSYKGIWYVILLAKLHDMYLYKTDTFPHLPIKSISKVAFLHRFHYRDELCQQYQLGLAIQMSKSTNLAEFDNNADLCQHNWLTLIIKVSYPNITGFI